MPGNTPSLSEVHVNRPMTAISIAYIQDQDNFIAAKAFPNIPVTKQADRYFTYPRGHFFRDTAKKRVPGTESAGATYDIDSTPSYYAEAYALHKDIPDAIRANADNPLDMDRDATIFLTQQTLLRREKVWAANYFVTGVWTNQKAGAASADGTHFKYWDASGSTPIQDVRSMKRQVLGTTGFKPNKLILGRVVFDTLMDHPDLVDRIKYGQTGGDTAPAIVNKAILAQIFEVDEVLVMDGIENTAAEGLTDSYAFIGGKHALLVYAPPQPGIMTPSAGYTFSWTGYTPGVTGVEGNTVSMIRADLLKSDRAEIEMAFDMKLVSADLGYMALGIVQQS